SVVGTPAYMSPEQARGEGLLVDGRSDIYSLGVMLYEMLCGRRPFEARNTGELLRVKLDQDPIPPRQLVGDIPPKLERICLKAMARRVTDRYTTAADLAEDLRRWLEGSRVTAAWKSVAVAAVLTAAVLAGLLALRSFF